MKIGDIVRGYHKGYWRVVEIERRFYTPDYFKYSSYEEIEPGVYKYKYETQGAIPETVRIGDEYSPLVHLKQVARADFKPVNQNSIKTCDAEWCRVVTEEELDGLAARYMRNIEALRWWIKEGNNVTDENTG